MSDFLWFLANASWPVERVGNGYRYSIGNGNGLGYGFPYGHGNGECYGGGWNDGRGYV